MPDHPTIHVHTPSPPDEYGPRRGLAAAQIEVCECGWERRSGDGLPSGWHPPRSWTGRVRAAAWSGSSEAGGYFIGNQEVRE